MLKQILLGEKGQFLKMNMCLWARGIWSGND